MKILSGLIVLLLVLGGSTGAADEPKKKADAEKPAPAKATSVYQAAVPKTRDRTVKVWTNADLDSLGREPFATTPASGATGGGGGSASQPLQWLEAEEQRAQSRQERIAMAQSQLAAAESKLANLEKQLLATVNPFSARPQLSEAEKEERLTTEESALERNKRTQKMVDDARAEVETARANLRRTKSGR